MQCSTQPGGTLTYNLCENHVPEYNWILVGANAKSSPIVDKVTTKGGIMKVTLKKDLDPAKLGPSLDILDQQIHSSMALRSGQALSRQSITDVIGVHSNK